MIVADPSLLVSLLTDGGSNGQAARKAFAESRAVFVPDVAYVETVELLRLQWLRGTLLAERCRAAIEDLNDLPMSSCPTRPLLPRALSLWAHATTMQACYIALAEALRCDLVTGDQRLAAATDPRCQIRAAGLITCEGETTET